MFYSPGAESDYTTTRKIRELQPTARGYRRDSNYTTTRKIRELQPTDVAIADNTN